MGSSLLCVPGSVRQTGSDIPVRTRLALKNHHPVHLGRLWSRKGGWDSPSNSAKYNRRAVTANYLKQARTELWPVDKKVLSFTFNFSEKPIFYECFSFKIYQKVWVESWQNLPDRRDQNCQQRRAICVLYEQQTSLEKRTVWSQSSDLDLPLGNNQGQFGWRHVRRAGIHLNKTDRNQKFFFKSLQQSWTLIIAQNLLFEATNYRPWILYDFTLFSNGWLPSLLPTSRFYHNLFITFLKRWTYFIPFSFLSVVCFNVSLFFIWKFQQLPKRFKCFIEVSWL